MSKSTGYRSVLAYLPRSEIAISVLDAATLLVDGAQSHVDGLYVTPAPSLHACGLSFSASGVVEDIEKRHYETHAMEAAAVKAVFDAKAGEGAYSANWCCANAPSADCLPIVVDHANRSEIVVAPQPGRGRDDLFDPLVCERLLIEAGRPVLVVPDNWSGVTVGSKITIGFDGSREAVRAVFDALPLLKRAEIVRLANIGPDNLADHNANWAGAELADALDRYDVACDAVRAPRNGGTPAAELGDLARDHGSDLIVLGVRGQPSFSAIEFGAVTRAMLDDPPLPLFMAH